MLAGTGLGSPPAMPAWPAPAPHDKTRQYGVVPRHCNHAFNGAIRWCRLSNVESVSQGGLDPIASGIRTSQLVVFP